MIAQSALHILLVEDSPTDTLLAREALSNHRFHIQSSERLTEAMKMLTRKHFDVVLLDLGLPDSQGLDTLRTLRLKHPQIAVVVLTGKDDEELATDALQEGAQDYLLKGELQAAPLQRALRYAVERTTSERLLRQSEERLQELTEHIRQVLWVIDAKESKVLYVSPGYEAMWGRSSQTLVENPHSYLDGIHPLDQERMSHENAKMLTTGFIDAECRVLHPDNSVRWVWIRGYPVTSNHQVVRLVGIIEDITDKKYLEVERDALLSRLQLHIERMPLAYILFDSALRIIDWNPAAERIFGYTKEEIIGSGPPLEQIVPPEVWRNQSDLFKRFYSGDMQAHSTNDNSTKDGRIITCEWINTPLLDEEGAFTGLLCLAQDVTERKKAEAQLLQSQKMEVVGQLAGGVAHDFNNMLAVILSCSQLLGYDATLEAKSRQLVEDTYKAANRAATLTRQLLAFSRQQVLQPRILNLNEVVMEAVTLLERLIGENINLQTSLDTNLWPVKVDAGQMNQVIMNLGINARDAMSEGGSLTIGTSNVELDEQLSRLHSGVPTGQYVMLSVSDTGCGMDDETMVHMFEPFFTTKPIGKGTGLGLPTVFGIVKQSGGHVNAHSEVGKGTSFRVYLPIDESAPGLTKAGTKQTVLPRGSETVMVVDDEDMIRELTCRILESQGYSVVQARNGDEALMVHEAQQGPIHLLLTDVVMPKMGGRQLYDRLRAMQPDLKVLFMSGYTDDAVIRHGIVEAETHFIEKPFTFAAMANAVRSALDN